jgi:hypothetical protein
VRKLVDIPEEYIGSIFGVQSRNLLKNATDSALGLLSPSVGFLPVLLFYPEDGSNKYL